MQILNYWYGSGLRLLGFRVSILGFRIQVFGVFREFLLA